jgi:hypothetical protein
LKTKASSASTTATAAVTASAVRVHAGEPGQHGGQALVGPAALAEVDAHRVQPARPPLPNRPLSVMYDAMPMNTSTTSERTLPPPRRSRFLLAQPPASVMPTPNSSPPTSSDSHGSTGRCATAFDRSTWPAGQRAGAGDRHRDGQQPHAHAAPVAHVDDVGQAPMVQKLVLAATSAEDEGDREAADHQDRWSAAVALMKSPRRRRRLRDSSGARPKRRC